MAKRPVLWKTVRVEIDEAFAKGFESRDDAVRWVLMEIWPTESDHTRDLWQHGEWEWSGDYVEEVLERASLRTLRLIYTRKLEWRKKTEKGST